MSSLEGVLSTVVMGPEEIAGLDAPMLYEDDTQRLSYSSGDRELLRLYRGPALSPLAFAALRLSPFTSLSAYFNPPLEAAFAGELERERACALAFFRVPDPAQLASQAQAYTRSVTGAERAAWAMAMAGRYDAADRKSVV